MSSSTYWKGAKIDKLYWRLHRYPGVPHSSYHNPMSLRSTPSAVTPIPKLSLPFSQALFSDSLPSLFSHFFHFNSVSSLWNSYYHLLASIAPCGQPLFPERGWKKIPPQQTFPLSLLRLPFSPLFPPISNCIHFQPTHFEITQSRPRSSWKLHPSLLFDFQPTR